MGLFPHHPADPATVRASASTSAGKGGAYTFVSGELGGRASTASLSASGDIQGPVATSTTEPQGSSQELSQASYLASGSLNQFAEAIDIYNKGVDRLNERYENAKAADFYVGAPVCTADGGTTETNPPEDRDAAIAAADSKLKGELKAELKKLEDDLDTAAEAVSGQLKKGPDDKTITLMIAAGYLPESAAKAFPGIDLGTLDTIRKYFSLARTTWKAPDKFVKLYKMFATGKDLAATAAELASSQHQWNAILGAVARNLDTTSLASLNTFMQSREELSILQYTKLFAEADNANAVNGWVNAAKATGKIGGPLAALGLVSSSIDLGDLIINGNDGKGAVDTTLRATADVTGIVSAGGGLLALTPVLSLGPVGAGVLIGAGLVSAGITIYRNWDEISAGAAKAADWAGDRLEDAGEAISDGWDAITPW